MKLSTCLVLSLILVALGEAVGVEGNLSHHRRTEHGQHLRLRHSTEKAASDARVWLEEKLPPHQLISKMDGHPLTFAAIFIVVFVAVAALISYLVKRKDSNFVTWVGTLRVNAFRRVLPLGAAVIIIAGIGSMEYMLDFFSPFATMATLITVMELGTYEKLIVKATFRALGCTLGALESILSCLLIDVCGHHAMVVFVCLAFVVVMNACFQKLYGKFSYVFLTSNIIFVILIYGFFYSGWSKVWHRLISCYFAIFLAFFIDLLWPIIMGDTIVSSLDSVVSNTEKVIKSIWAIIDWTFVYNEVMTHEGGTLAKELWKGRKFQPDTTIFFKMTDEKLTFDDLLKESGNAAHKARVKRANEVAAFHVSTSAAWNEAVLASQLMCRAPPDANLHKLSEKLHPMYGQACSVSHIVYSDFSDTGKKIWRHNQVALDKIRSLMMKLQEPFLALVKQCHNDPSKVIDTAAQIADLLVEIENECSSLMQKITQTVRRPSIMLVDPKDSKWRFRALVMALELLIVEMASYTRLALKNFAVHNAEFDALKSKLLDLSADVHV